MPTDAPALRRDAAENRSRILAESARLFAENGPDIDVREIARAAEVGMGTLYRHFPTKEALLAAVVQRWVVEWVDAARDAPRGDPWDDLRSFLDDALRRHADHRALLGNAGTALLKPETVEANRRLLRSVIEGLVSAAHASGVLRRDVTAVDIHLLLIALGRLIPLGPEAWQRQLDIALDGLRTPEPTPLRSPPMSPRRFERADLNATNRR